MADKRESLTAGDSLKPNTPSLRGVTNDYGRKVAAEWVAMTAMQPYVKGREVPFFEFDRIPTHQKELAKMLGIANPTLSRWINTDEAFKKAVTRNKRKFASENLMSHITVVDEVLVSRAKSGDTRAMRIYYDELSKREGWDSLRWDELPDGLETADKLIVSIREIANRIKALKDEPREILVETTDAEIIDVSPDRR